MGESSRSSRERRRGLILAFAFVIGILVIGGSLINSLAFDLIERGFREARLPGCKIVGAEVAGSVLTGFLISDLKLLSEESSREILVIEAAYLRLGLTDLLRGEVVVDFARISGVRSSAAEFRRLLALKEIQDAVTSSTKNSLLGELKLRNVQFRGLRIAEPLELFLSEEQLLAADSNLRLIADPVFDGSLDLSGGRFGLRARLRSGKDKESSLQLSMLLDARRLVGEALVEAGGVHVDELISWQGQKVPGTLAMEARLAFSPRSEELKGENPAMIRLSDQDRLYYTLKGEARLLSTGLLVQSVPLQDIYLRTRWTHDEFSISPMEVSILGQRFSVEAEGNGEGFTAKLDADAIELSEFLGSLGGRGASDWLSGSFDVRARWDGNQIHVEPIRLQNLKVAGMAARLEPFQVRLRNPARIELYSVGGEAAQGALLSPLIRLEEGVLSLSAGLKDMRPSLFPKIAPLMEKLGMKGELMAEMKASIPLNRPESSAMQLEGKLVRLEAFGFPAESLSFEANATTSSIVLSGVLKLPLEDGGVNFQARLDEEEGWLHLHSRRLDTGFLRYRFSSLPVGGVIDDASLRFQFYPVWEGSLEMKSTELRYASQSFRNFSLHSNLKPDRAWFKIVDDSLRFSVHGTHILSFPQDAALLLELPRHLKNAHAELSEKNLARLIPLGLGRFIHLDHGALQMSANWNEKDLELVVETLQLEARNTRLELGKPARIGMGGAGADGEILLKLSQEGGSLVLRAGQNRLGLELKDLKASSLQAFAPVSWPVHATARLNAKMLWEEPLQPKQSVLAEIKARNLNLNAWGKPMFVDAIDVKAGYRNGLIRVDHLHLIRNKAELHASLRMPSDAVFTAQKFADLPFRAEFKAPGFALQDIKPLLPDSVKELKGDFAADLVVENSLQGQLEATGYLRALMEPLEYDDPQTGRIYLDRLRLDATLSQQTLKLTTLSLRLENFYADLVGRLTLENDFPFELAGRAHSPLFEVSWLKLENASIEGLNLLGRLGSIQGSGRLKYDTGLVRHDALMLWLDEPHSPLSIPGFEDHHFHLQVRSNSRPTVLQGGLFRFELEPAFDVHLDRMGALMDGSARVVRGRMDIARNRFEAEPSSLIRFVPKRPVFKLGKPDEAAKNLLPQGIWEQNDFAMASLEQKLSMLWKQQPQNLRLKYQDDSSFETWLKLRATSRRNSSQLELSVNGPLNALNPVILQNGQPLAQEDAQKLGIGAVPGRHTGSSTQEEQLVSSQLTASVEDQLIGRRFEGLLRDVFGLNHVSLQSGLIQNPAVTAQSGAGFRLGTSLSKDVEVYHEQETLGSSTINRTQLEFRLSPGTDLWFEQKRETYDFKSVLGEEKDVQFGIQRKWRF